MKIWTVALRLTAGLARSNTSAVVMRIDSLGYAAAPVADGDGFGPMSAGDLRRHVGPLLKFATISERMTCFSDHPNDIYFGSLRKIRRPGAGKRNFQRKHRTNMRPAQNKDKARRKFIFKG
ncbi:hypothetical protein KL86PLE_100069 [uncultured Pleomorphomonas sp.]|uniref:Uncharacterized protein n=1 Tax=uncultured Pleomorphomonas sp. TaxID=442121 RepID=A0A212L133_9HYPH|nr:hypothetical protein KL86PLE_100069 [uncultured Pleomorphomonas sp.]